MLKLYFFLAFLVNFVGCGNNQVEALENGSGSFRELVPLQSLKKICENVSGTKFYSSLNYCACSNSGQYFVVIDLKGKCIQNLSDDMIEEVEPLISTEPEKEECIFCILNDFSDWDSSDTESIESETEVIKTYMSRGFFGIDSNIEIFSQNNIPNINPALASANKNYYQQIVLSVFIDPDNERLQAYLAGLFNYDLPRSGRSYQEKFVFSDSSNYSNAFQGGNLSPVSTMGLRKQSQILVNAYNQLINDEISVKSYGHCAVFCYIDFRWEVAGHPDTEIRIFGYRSYGSSVRTTITWQSILSGDVYALMQLTPSNRIASILEIDAIEVGNKIINKYSILEYPFRNVELEIEALLIDTRRARELVRNETIEYNSVRPHVLVCDVGDINKPDSTREKVNFVKGFESSSLLGWLAQGETANSIKYDAVASTLGNTIMSPESHLYSVSSAIFHTYKSLSDDYWGVGIIPVGYQNCTRNFDLLEKSLAQTNTKVINVSVSEMIHINQCHQSKIVKKIENSKDSYLWVMAAGNAQYERNPQGKYCPQQASGGHNVIIVSQQGLSHGDRYSDIYSDRDLNYGSTFAAATVSALAAYISKLYPQLKIWQIRMAILASGDLDFSLKAKVKTSSRLNRQRAINAAKIISGLGPASIDWTLTQLLKRLYRERESDQRYFLYQGKGLFPVFLR